MLVAPQSMLAVTLTLIDAEQPARTAIDQVPCPLTIAPPVTLHAYAAPAVETTEGASTR